ncbi:MAG: sugar phosphate isomerase/epimerase [Caldilineales bacterium]|nr:sugar phosphate isomerase/epimerase [Caldilineales bacterium]
MTMKPALSTMWMQNRSAHVRDWWGQVQALGFEQIELSHIITPPMLAGLRPGEIPISSVHYPAPVVPHPHDTRLAEILISSPDPVLREWAVAQGKASIDLAAAWGAKAVCIHAGRSEAPHRLEWTLYQRFYGGWQGMAVYDQALAEVLAARREMVEPNLSAIRRSLHELARHAQAAGIRLGIETRLHILEIPSLEEAQIILAEHDPDVLGLWYDCGHVQVQANLGMPNPQAWLDACGPRIIAAHLHDTLALRDHLPPGQGQIDFAMIAATLPDDALRICELDWYLHPAEIQAAVSFLADAGCCLPLN